MIEGGKLQCFGSQKRQYEQQMHVVEPYVYARMESGFFEREKGQKIYYEHYKADDPKG